MRKNNRYKNGVGSAGLIVQWCLMLVMLSGMTCREKKPEADGTKLTPASAATGAVVMHAGAAQGAYDKHAAGDFVTEIIAIMSLTSQLQDQRIGAQLNQDDIEDALAEQKAEVRLWDKKRLEEWSKAALARFNGDSDGRLGIVELAAARSLFINRIFSMRQGMEPDWAMASDHICPELPALLKSMRPKGGLYVIYERVALKCAGMTLPDSVGLSRSAFCLYLRSQPFTSNKYSSLIDTVNTNCALAPGGVPQQHRS